jgi:hypothetical protein
MNKWYVVSQSHGSATSYDTEADARTQATALSVSYPMTAVGIYELHTIMCAEKPVVVEKKVR